MRFNHVLLFLMAVSALSAFVMPPGAGISFRGKLDVLFVPVAVPVRSLASVIDGRIATPRPKPSDENVKRTPEQIRDENESLKYQVGRLIDENEELRRKLNEQLLLGDIARFCRVVKVLGGDVGTQQVLSFHGPGADGLVPNMPVLTVYAFVGKVDAGAARVRLITDNASTVSAEFKRYRKDRGEFIRLPQSPKIVQGNGDGTMVIKSFKASELENAGAREFKLAVGDWVTLCDKELPTEVQGKKLGEIESINPSRSPGFYNLIIRPDEPLMKLKEVMVMVKN